MRLTLTKERTAPIACDVRGIDVRRPRVENDGEHDVGDKLRRYPGLSCRRYSERVESSRAPWGYEPASGEPAGPACGSAEPPQALALGTDKTPRASVR
jgi:hypothetical protein